MLTRYFVTLLQYASTFPVLYCCYEESIITLLQTVCAALASENICSALFAVLLFFAGMDDTVTMSFFGVSDTLLDWGIYYLIHLLTLLALYLLFGRVPRETADEKSRKALTFLSIGIFLAITVLSSFVSQHRAESPVLYVACRSYSVLAALFVLIIRSDLFHASAYRTEISTMEGIIAQERNQYKLIKQNIDYINVHCHDLKNRLATLTGRLNEEDIRTLQEAMTIYEENIKTGNDVLDTVMYENQVLCKQAGIRLSCLADGELLSFMRTRHLYAIFSNALRNAIEAASLVENPEKRVVSMTVGAHHDMVEISIINYFSGQVKLCNDLPAVTSKAERNQHGFGMKSITYAAAQYNGTVKATVEEDVFSLLIAIPIPQESKAKKETP